MPRTKYRIYTIIDGEETTILETPSAETAKHRYARCAREGAGVRASINGRTMRICEADKWAELKKYFARGRTASHD